MHQCMLVHDSTQRGQACQCMPVQGETMPVPQMFWRLRCTSTQPPIKHHSHLCWCRSRVREGPGSKLLEVWPAVCAWILSLWLDLGRKQGHSALVLVVYLHRRGRAGAGLVALEGREEAHRGLIAASACQRCLGNTNESNYYQQLQTDTMIRCVQVVCARQGRKWWRDE